MTSAGLLHLLSISLLLLPISVSAQGQQHRHGQGPQDGRHGRHGRMSGDTEHSADRDLFHFLLDNREDIRRTVTQIQNGVETLTESDNAELSDAIKKHVKSMHSRILERRPIHQRDPLFRALFEQSDKIKFSYEETARGVRVRETSEDPFTVQLIQQHADVVSLFVANGRSEAQKNHQAPPIKRDQ